MKKINSLVLLLIFGICLYILFFQPEWLGITLLSNPLLPLGSLVAWVMLASYSFFAYFISPDDPITKLGKGLKLVLKIFLLPASFWGLFSYLIAGNWTYNFDNKIKFNLWIIYTALILFVPLVTLVLMVIRRIISGKPK